MGSRSKSASKSAIRPKTKPSRAASGTHGGTHAGSNGRSNGESAKPARPARDYSIAAVARTLDLLEALAVVGPAPLATVADAARCTRTAGFRLLRTLQSRGFAIQDEARGVWRLGARWTALGQAAENQGALAATAMPFMNELAKACGENVYLHVRDGQMGETVAIMQADPGLRVYGEVGKRQPLHAGPYRLLLAHAPEAVQTQVLAQKLPRFTPATRTDPAWIAADLQRIRARGYLVTADEISPGAVSVTARCAMPVGRWWRRCASPLPRCGCVRRGRARWCRWRPTRRRGCRVDWGGGRMRPMRSRCRTLLPCLTARTFRCGRSGPTGTRTAMASPRHTRRSTL